MMKTDIPLKRLTALLRAVRLWALDATMALESGVVGLAVFSPLMQRASAATVEQAVLQVLTTAPEAQQADLLAILGVFAEPLVPAEPFVQRVG